MKKYIVTSAVFIIFFGALALFTASADNDAQGIRNGVLRFHVVANSDSDSDQQNKLAVRDGIAELCSDIFGGADGKADAMAAAEQNSDTIEKAAERILRLRGNGDSVQVSVTKRFFPTRSYDGVSLPAGVYDTVDVKIGAAEGKNFWCVMFPDICIAGSDADRNREKMSDVLDGGSLSMATESDDPSVKLKFKVVEIFETVKNVFFN